MRMYLDGQDKLDKEFDIVNIVQNLRKLTILLKQDLRDKKRSNLIENSRRNWLVLDTSDLSEQSDSQKSEFSQESRDSEDRGTSHRKINRSNNDESYDFGKAATMVNSIGKLKNNAHDARERN